MKSLSLRLSVIMILLAGFSSGVPANIEKAEAAGERVYLLRLNDDTINPITAEYIAKGIDLAEEKKAQCLIIEMDTPGGLLASTRQIVKYVLSADVPVVVYISPGGSRAGSAGVFITYAAHIAAMAPSTNIGAAHPIQMGRHKSDPWKEVREILKETKGNLPPDPSQDAEKHPVEVKPPEPEEAQSPEEAPDFEYIPDNDALDTKILQDTVAFIRAMAHLRGRNEEWAIKSVTKSLSITETEALQQNVIDIIAQDEKDLLKQMDGKTVKVRGMDVTLKTARAEVFRVDMSARQQFYNVLANPNIAYLFLILGFLSLLYEITSPGFGVPGILGSIFLILAFFSMQMLPTNYAGLALILVGLGLLIAEAFVPGFGVMTTGGVVCMFLGSVLLFDRSEPIMRVSMPIIISILGTTAFITSFLLRLAIKTFRQKPVSGQEGMIGALGVTKKDFGPGVDGKVFVHGELWNAVTDEALSGGDKIIVVAINGLTLKVRKSLKS
ncbi:MAG TPA: nodulation protein NfeD [Candidatus Omnitrophota bacterium]|nr:nodulation protein NfeD [Candidatus Omnitrophota bacterium]HPN56560.1 nodulation protein NfeD [Candidatus Omnitrophota bacterium]